MSIDTGQEALRVSARRRLLRGAFSAPAALTLYSGRAIAAASNLRCVANQQGTNAISPVPLVSSLNETYVRIGLYKKTSADRYFVKGADLQGLSISGSFTGLPSSSQARRFDILANKFDKAAGNIPDLEPTPTKWAVLRIDGTGTVVGIGVDGPVGGSAIYQSCWTSFKIGSL